METEAHQPNRALGIFAKAPVPGRVKTRLAAEIGAEPAAAWYARSLVTLFQRTSGRWPHVEVILFFDPPDAGEIFRRMPAVPAVRIPQVAGDLGYRMRVAFDECRTRGGDHIVLIGSDAPTLPMTYVEDAWTMLERTDVVLGPARDGGYYLIGLRESRPDLFTDVAWSTNRVFATTHRRAEASGLRVAVLQEWFDVDTAADLAELGDDWARASGDEIISIQNTGDDVPI